MDTGFSLNTQLSTFNYFRVWPGRNPYCGDQTRLHRYRRYDTDYLLCGKEALRPIISSTSYILRQGWTGLDFSDEVELAELRRLHESLQLEIIAVIESLEQLKESAEYELCGMVEQRPGVLDELAAERVKLLEKESVELEREAEKLADEIKELSGAEVGRIV